MSSKYGQVYRSGPHTSKKITWKVICCSIVNDKKKNFKKNRECNIFFFFLNLPRVHALIDQNIISYLEQKKKQRRLKKIVHTQRREKIIVSIVLNF